MLLCSRRPASLRLEALIGLRLEALASLARIRSDSIAHLMQSGDIWLYCQVGFTADRQLRKNGHVRARTRCVRRTSVMLMATLGVPDVPDAHCILQ